MLHYAQIQLRYDTNELNRKGKVVKGVARIRRREYKARRITLQSDWIVQPRSRQLLPGWAQGIETNTPHDWLVEPSNLVTRRDSVPALCKDNLWDYIPNELTDVQLKTASVIPKQVNKASRDCQTSQELPEELQTLVEEAKMVINPQQAQEFWQLLLDYRDIFSTKDEP